MNRLWVRFMLIVTGILMLVALVPVLLGVAFETGLISTSTNVDQLADIRAALPEEMQARFDERMQDFAQNYFSRALLTALVLSAVIGALLSRTLTAPLQSLEEGAKAIATQELSYRVPVKGSQEMQSVARAFNQMAVQLDEAEVLRRNLLADVAHELRNPLHVLRGNLQAILDDVYPLTKEEIARLLDQTRMLTTLVDDLHDLAQAEAHQMPLHKQMVDMADLVKETAVSFKPVAAAKNVKVTVELLGATPYLRVDANRMRQAVYNLLNNALRHTPENGEIWITVVEQSGRLHIRVHDTGEGIAAAHLPFVFDRFYRTDSARSRDRGGTGLGLAIVKAIVEAHEGEVTAVSPGLGLGSTFEIVLPS
ncbi:MAG: HAMP domain-containing protein [Ardenticatenaceae bacterium]|nr:HAMP domain-containing protein [Ardenticatenaceae bacterium]